MMNHKMIATVAASVLLVLLASGCTGSLADPVNELLYEIPEEEQGTITLDTKNGEMTISSFAERSELLPDKIPLPDGSVIHASFDQPEISSTTLIADVQMPLEDVVQLYKEYVESAGYISTMPVTEDEEIYWFAGTLETEQLVVILNKDLEQLGKTTISLTYRKGE